MNVAKAKSHSIGFVFGFTQFVQYAVPSVLYYAGARLLDSGKIPYENADHVFIAIFSMMMGAMASGQAQ